MEHSEKISLYFSLAIKVIRDRRKMSQEELASRSNLDLSTVNRIEKNRRSASLNSLSKIAAALDQTVESMFTIGKKEAHKMENNQITQKTANMVRTLRHKNKLTITELSNLSGVSGAHISRIETGVTSVTTETLNSILTAFNIKLSEFYSMIDN